MPKNLTQKQIIIIAGGVIIVVLIAVVVFFNFRKSASSTQVTLTIWGTDDQAALKDILAPYDSSNSGYKITYTQVDPAQYQTKLLAALAGGVGPDIFEIGNRDLPQWQSVAYPLPAVNAQNFNLVALENDFPTTVEQDFVSSGNIYALPFAIDTLAMIYNKDLFDSAGIATPPKTWNDFQSDVAQLRVVNGAGQVTQAAAAIGGSSASIPTAADILFLLMLQNGTKMTSSDYSSISFASGVGSNGTANPGLSAFNFYLQFANAASPYYTWSDAMGDARQSFIQGKTAILFDYQAETADILAKAPFLNMGIAPMPQPSGATVVINYPKYSGFAVARTANYLNAWNFVLKLTLAPANDTSYASHVGGAPALRSAIQAAITDPSLTVFASQALTARSWHDPNEAQVAAIMSTAIQNVLTGATDSGRALNQAQSSVSDILHSQ